MLWCFWLLSILELVCSLFLLFAQPFLRKLCVFMCCEVCAVFRQVLGNHKRTCIPSPEKGRGFVGGGYSAVFLSLPVSLMWSLRHGPELWHSTRPVEWRDNWLKTQPIHTASQRPPTRADITLSSQTKAMVSLCTHTFTQCYVM